MSEWFELRDLPGISTTERSRFAEQAGAIPDRSAATIQRDGQRILSIRSSSVTNMVRWPWRPARDTEIAVLHRVAAFAARRGVAHGPRRIA